MNETYVILSETGDEYKLQFTTEHNGLIAAEVLDTLQAQGVEMVDVGLGRSKGVNVTSHKVLAQIEECIAQMLQHHPNAMLCFFCDFISLIPSTKKNLPVQEYRSRLFSNMFNRYVSQHKTEGIRNRVVTIEGVAEKFYVHMIVREKHVKYTDMIAQSLQHDFEKPE